MATVLYDVISALVSKAQESLPNAVVSDGLAVTQDPGDYLWIGVDDPDTADFAGSASGTQVWKTLGATQREDRGNVACVAESWVGDVDAALARTNLRAMTDAFEDALKADPTLSGAIPDLMWTGFGATYALQQTQSENGAVARLRFTVAYVGYV